MSRAGECESWPEEDEKGLGGGEDGGSEAGGKKWQLYCPQGSGTLRQQLIMMHGIAWSFKVLDCIEYYCMVLHCIAWYCTVLLGFTWYCIILHGIA